MPDVQLDLSYIGAGIDWDEAPKRLRAGDLSAIDPEAARVIEWAAALPDVVAMARRLNITPVILILALLARVQAGSNRSAARVARAVLGSQASAEIDALCAQLGLDFENGAHAEQP